MGWCWTSACRVACLPGFSTLWVLTLITLFVFAVSSAIDDVRARILINYGVVLDQRVSGRLFAGLFDGLGADPHHPLRVRGVERHRRRPCADPHQLWGGAGPARVGSPVCRAFR